MLHATVHADSDRQLATRVIAIACVVSLTLVVIDLWANRNLTDSDGLAYIDMADAYSRGDWQAALVGVWSPLYPWLLALMMLVIRPAAQWEYTALHALNLFIYLVTLASFTLFVRTFLRTTRESDSNARVPDWLWLLFGYSLFTWSVIRLAPPHQPQPDLLVCALLFAIFTLLLRIRAGALSWGASISFGALLGLGYLAKGIMFPLAFVFIGVALVLVRRSRQKLVRVGVAFSVFLLLSLPYILVLSHANGRWMFNDAGRLNYAWEINEVKKWSHWQGGDPVHGSPLHPTREIHDNPPMYEYATPFNRVTYPPWYDPSYWYQGVKLTPDVPRQLKVLARNSYALLSFLANSPGSPTEDSAAYRDLRHGNERTIGALLALFCAVSLAGLGRASILRRISEHWALLVPTAAALGAYALLHFEGRYIAAYAVVIWMLLFRSAAAPDSPASRRFVAAVLASAALITFATVTVGTADTAWRAARDYVDGYTEAPIFQSGYSDWKVAKYLRKAGLHQGDRVAGVGWTYNAYWARMDRLHVVAEIPLEGASQFWSLAPSERTSLLHVFEDAGAKAVVANNPPGGAATPDWVHIARTPY
jgi:hypothetical protein